MGRNLKAMVEYFTKSYSDGRTMAAYAYSGETLYFWSWRDSAWDRSIYSLAALQLDLFDRAYTHPRDITQFTYQQTVGEACESKSN